MPSSFSECSLTGCIEAPSGVFPVVTLYSLLKLGNSLFKSSSAFFLSSAVMFCVNFLKFLRLFPPNTYINPVSLLSGLNKSSSCFLTVPISVELRILSIVSIVTSYPNEVNTSKRKFLFIL